MQLSVPKTATVVSFVLALTAAPEAQSLYAIDGVGDGSTPEVLELSGPPGGACGIPDGPLISSFLPGGGAPCLGPSTFAPPPASPPVGDVAVDMVTDTVYLSDGTPLVASYDAEGTFLDSFAAPLGLIVGMSFDAVGGLLWITDGLTYGAVTPPPAPGCMAVVGFAVGPFAVPMGAGFFSFGLADFAWDPASATLLGCDVTGVVASFVPGPAALAGPYGGGSILTGPCALAARLVGIAMDHTLPGTGTYYVTDGTTIAYLAPGGVAAPLTAYTTATCTTVPGPAVSGLAFAARPLTYGMGADTTAAPAPSIGSVSQVVVPNPALMTTLSGSVSGGIAVLFGSFSVLCPAATVIGLPVNISVAPLVTITTTIVDAAGEATVSTPIPGTVPPGVTVAFQWLVATSLPSLQVSNALLLNVALP